MNKYFKSNTFVVAIMMGLSMSGAGAAGNCQAWGERFIPDRVEIPLNAAYACNIMKADSNDPSGLVGWKVMWISGLEDEAHSICSTAAAAALKGNKVAVCTNGRDWVVQNFNVHSASSKK